MHADPRRVVAEALAGSGVDLVGGCSVGAYDARAPAGFRSADVMPRARGVVVVGSAGRALWSALRADRANVPGAWEDEHPLDAFVARALDRVDVALGLARVGSRRFEPTLVASPMLDFRALGELAGLGAPSPIGLLVHPEHGPWWALRGAWLVDVPVADPAPCARACEGCAAPCVSGAPVEERTAALLLATPAARSRCLVGSASRYSDEQIGWHYDRAATRARLVASDPAP
jgi:epoxyqueuosine reductase QueG